MMRSHRIGKFKRSVVLWIAFCVLTVSIATDWSFVSLGSSGENNTVKTDVTVSMENVANVLERTSGAGIDFDRSVFKEDAANISEHAVLVEQDTYNGLKYYVLVTMQDDLWNEEDEPSILNAVEDISVVFVNQSTKKRVELPEVNVIAYDNIKFTVSQTPDTVWEEDDVDEATPSYSRRVNRIASSSDSDAASGSDAKKPNSAGNPRVLMPRSAKRILIVHEVKAAPSPMDYITAIEVFKSDKNGNPISVPNTGLQVTDGILLKYKYEIPGDYGLPSAIVKDIPYQFDMPKGIILERIPEFDLFGTLAGDENLVIGKGAVSADGTSATITFTDKAEENGYLKGGAKGEFYMACGADKNEIGHGGTIPLAFSVAGVLKEIEFNFALNDIKADVKIAKTGILKNKDDSKPGLGKANVIAWTITVTPKMEQCFNQDDNKLTSLEVQDIFHESQGLILDQASVKVFKKEEPRDLFASGNLKDVSDKGFTYVLADPNASSLTVNPDDYYRITFDTSFNLNSWAGITGDEIKFTNDAKGSYTHKKYELDAGKPVISLTEATGTIAQKQATVNVKGDFLSKTGRLLAPVNPSDDDWTILWTLTLNKNGFALGDVLLTDKLNVEGDPYAGTIYSFADFKRWNSLDTSETPFLIPANGDGLTTFPDKNEFTLDLKNVNTPVTVQYTTSVPIDYIKNNAQSKFVNKVDLTSADVNLKGIGAGVPVGARIIQKTSKYDTSNHTISWTIAINHDALLLDDVVVTDILPDSMTYVDGTLTAGKTTDLSYDDGTKTITVKYNSLNSSDEIKFDTKINNPYYWASNFNEASPAELGNSAVIHAVGMSAPSYTANHTPTVKSNVITKDVKTALNLDTRETVWKLNINTNKMLMTNPVITEKIPEGQKFVSVTGGAEYVKKIEPANIDETTREVKIFLNDIGDVRPQDRIRSIELKTEVTDLTILTGNNNPSIYNYAEFVCDEMGKEPPATAQANTRIPQKFITKTGDNSNSKVKNKMVGWTVVINNNLARVSDVVITDRLPDNLSLKVDSVKLLKNGKEEMPQSFYKISYSKPDFKLVINQEISESYTLKFDTYFKLDDNNCTNSIDVSAMVGGSLIQAEAASQPISANWAAAGGTGEPPAPGSLTVIKKDESGNPIKDVQFCLDGFGEIKTTDAQGKVVFDEDMWPGNYTLIEVSAPDKYKLGSPQSIKLGVKENKEITVVNEVKKGSLTVTKTDPEGNVPLMGAVFTLYKMNDPAGLDLTPVEPMSGKTTGADGKVHFTDLPGVDYGYVVKETTPPPSYTPSSEIFKFNILEDGKNYEWALTNAKIKSDVVVTKVDSVTGASVSGAEISITGTGQDNQGSSVKTTGVDGKARFNDLKFGTYIIAETKAPAGYHLSSEKLTIEVKTHKQEIPVEFKNDPIRGSLKIVKKAVDSETVLSGAEIALYEKNGKKVGLYTTGEDGSITIDSLRYGDYYYQEMKAPSGYILNETKYDLAFHIINEGEYVTVVLENKKVTSSGGGGGTSPKPGKPAENPGPGVLPTEPGASDIPPAEPNAPKQPERLPSAPAVNPEGTPPAAPTTSNPDGSTTIKVPSIPNISPESEVAVTDQEDTIVYRGRPDAGGTINVMLEPGDYSLYIIDEEGVPLAQMPFTILDEEVPLAGLPKTGETGTPGALLMMIILGIFASWIPIVVKSPKPLIWYKRKNKHLERKKEQ